MNGNRNDLHSQPTQLVKDIFFLLQVCQHTSKQEEEV